jgi:hypothetical protein
MKIYIMVLLTLLPTLLTIPDKTKIEELASIKLGKDTFTVRINDRVKDVEVCMNDTCIYQYDCQWNILQSPERSIIESQSQELPKEYLIYRCNNKNIAFQIPFDPVIYSKTTLSNLYDICTQLTIVTLEVYPKVVDFIRTHINEDNRIDFEEVLFRYMHMFDNILVDNKDVRENNQASKNEPKKLGEEDLLKENEKQKTQLKNNEELKKQLQQARQIQQRQMRNSRFRHRKPPNSPTKKQTKENSNESKQVPLKDVSQNIKEHTLVVKASERKKNEKVSHIDKTDIKPVENNIEEVYNFEEYFKKIAKLKEHFYFQKVNFDRRLNLLKVLLKESLDLDKPIKSFFIEIGLL